MADALLSSLGPWGPRDPKFLMLHDHRFDTVHWWVIGRPGAPIIGILLLCKCGGQDGHFFAVVSKPKQLHRSPGHDAAHTLFVFSVTLT